MAGRHQMTSILTCSYPLWRHNFSDPTLLGWGICLIYACTAIFSWRARHLSPRPLWIMVAVIMLTLCLNKQLDLQILLTGAIKCHATEYAWLNYRDFAQIFLTGLIALSALLCTFTLWLLVRRDQDQHWLLLIGFVLLSIFGTLRMAQFADLVGTAGWLLGHPHIFEILGIAAILVNAIRRVPHRIRTTPSVNLKPTDKFSLHFHNH